MIFLSKLGKNRWTIITSNTSVVILWIALIWLAYQLGLEDNTYLLNWLICLLGVVIGWGVGFITSPSSDNESERFSGMTKTVSAFLSGYILSKLDPVIESLLESNQIFQELFWVRMAFFLIAFFSTMIIVFINRMYLLNIVEKE